MRHSSLVIPPRNHHNRLYSQEHIFLQICTLFLLCMCTHIKQVQTQVCFSAHLFFPNKLAAIKSLRCYSIYLRSTLTRFSSFSSYSDSCFPSHKPYCSIGTLVQLTFIWSKRTNFVINFAIAHHQSVDVSGTGSSL